MHTLKITFCTTIMNRLHHLQQTLPYNLDYNLDYQNCEFLILDYNSTDGLEEWMRENMHHFQGKVKYYKTTEPIHYQRSHSRNMAMKLADGDILCNLDADNYTGPDFAAYVASVFEENQHCFLSPAKNSPSDTFGKICFKKDDFLRIRGYDEVIKTYGFEDNDLKSRLEASGLTEKYYSKPEFLYAITHTMQERIENEQLFKTIDRVFVEKIDYKNSKLFLLNTNETFDSVHVIDSFFNHEDDVFVKPIPVLNRYQIIEETMISGKTEQLNLGNASLIEDKDKIISVVYFVSQLKNKLRFLNNTLGRSGIINPEGFGEGQIHFHLTA